MNTQPTTPVSYCVEMSGWDVNENFFVEKTELEWTEEEKKFTCSIRSAKGQ
jgi:hypothetical protein